MPEQAVGRDRRGAPFPDVDCKEVVGACRQTPLRGYADLRINVNVREND